MKKIIALLLAFAMLLGLTACSRSSGGNDGVQVQYADPYSEYGEDYDARSQAIYDDALGEFLTAYRTAKEAQDQSARYALMAIAEAKLMASAVMLPLTAEGGSYNISRLAPYTIPNALWGNDEYRFHNALVTTRPITAAHREDMKAQWAELKGSGEYEDWAIP